MLSMINMNVLLIALLVVGRTSAVSYNQAKFCPMMSWNPDAITLPCSSEIDQPYNIFVITNNTAYVATSGPHLIKLHLEKNNCSKHSFVSGLFRPHSVFVTSNDDIYFYSIDDYHDQSGGGNHSDQANSQTQKRTNDMIFSRSFWSNLEYGLCLARYWYQPSRCKSDGTPPGNNNNNGQNHTNSSINDNNTDGNANQKNIYGKVYKWSSNANISVGLMNISGTCVSLFVDINTTIYCSVRDYHHVVKKALNASVNTSTIAAGTGYNGSTPSTLNYPVGIFVDINFDLYVADSFNHRIQLFKSGDLNGTTVAGAEKSETMALLYPTGVVLDTDQYLFIVDSGNHRIVRLEPHGFQCLVGCSEQNGSRPNQLFYPMTFSFDSHGNMLVVDTGNARIQKFLLATNSCNTTPPSQFVAPTCNGSTPTGVTCDKLNSLCKMLEPCKNSASCIDNNTIPIGYSCLCLPNSDGNLCQNSHRLCKPDTCWNNGTCIEVSNSKPNCTCEDGWHGEHCEMKINHCDSMPCMNKGVCYPSFMGFTCECLAGSYSGRHCEITSTKIQIYKIVSKSFAYVAIIAMIIVAIFIVIMDILKYCFGIDPVHTERERIQRRKKAKKRKPVIQRFLYVNSPTSMNIETTA